MKPIKPARSLIVSLHDVSPVSMERYDGFMGSIERMGVGVLSLLVVPCMHGRHPASSHPQFMSWLADLQSRGHEIIMHGCFHRASLIPRGVVPRFVSTIYTDREGEFYRITREKAVSLIETGLGMLSGRGLRIHGFIAPAWLLSDEGRDAAREMGFSYTTRLNQVELFREGVSIGAPSLVTSARSPWRRALSRLWVTTLGKITKTAPVLRVAVHPSDLDHPPLGKCLAEIIADARKTRTPMTYRDLLSPASLAAPVIA